MKFKLFKKRSKNNLQLVFFNKYLVSDNIWTLPCCVDKYILDIGRKYVRRGQRETSAYSLRSGAVLRTGIANEAWNGSLNR